MTAAHAASPAAAERHPRSRHIHAAATPIKSRFMVKGLRRGFKEELFHFEGTRRGRLIDSLGVTGHVAKGVALDLTGLLFIIAAARHRPDESTGLDGSLKALQGHPFGPTLLVAIGAGFIAYGIFALIRARFGRM